MPQIFAIHWRMGERGKVGGVGEVDGIEFCFENTLPYYNIMSDEGRYATNYVCFY